MRPQPVFPALFILEVKMSYKYKKIRLSKETTRDEHRIRYEKFIGRKLKKGEVVHHINGDTKDNRIENLSLMKNHEHAQLHYQNGDLSIKAKYSIEELIQALRKASELNKGLPLAEKSLKKLIGINGSTVDMRFKGWNRAKEIAGIL